MSQQNTYFLQTARKAMYSKHKCSWSKGIFSWKISVEIFLMLCSPRSLHQTMCLGCLLSCKNQLDQGQACSSRPSEEIVPFLISAVAFPWWACKHHIPFCTSVLIYKWRSLAAFERFLLLAGIVLFVAVTSFLCLISSALVFAFGNAT